MCISNFRYFITDTGCELAHQLLNGHSDLPLVPGSTLNKKTNTSKVNRGRRSPVPEAGEGLLSELRDIIGQLDHNSTNKKQNKSSVTITSPSNQNDGFGRILSDDLAKVPVRFDDTSSPSGGKRLGGGKRTDPFSPGGHYTKLEGNMKKNKVAVHQIPVNEKINKSFGVVDLDESYKPPEK